jgi:hypothetical protein
MGSAVMQLFLLDAMELGAATDAEIASNDERESALTTVVLVLYLCTGVAFVAWFHRAYTNLRAFEHEPLHRTGWAIYGWVVPIANFFRPYQIAREIWHVSDPQRAREAWVPIEGSPPLLVAWWALWVVGNLIGQVSFRMGMHADTIDSLRSLTITNLIVDGLSVVSVPLAILLVREISSRQETLWSRAAGSGLGESERDELQRVFE